MLQVGRCTPYLSDAPCSELVSLLELSCMEKRVQFATVSGVMLLLLGGGAIYAQPRPDPATAAPDMGFSRKSWGEAPPKVEGGDRRQDGRQRPEFDSGARFRIGTDPPRRGRSYRASVGGFNWDMQLGRAYVGSSIRRLCHKGGGAGRVRGSRPSPTGRRRVRGTAPITPRRY